MYRVIIFRRWKIIETLFNEIIEQAFDDNISDIYILPVGNSYEVKFRRAHFNELYVQLSSSKAQQLINFCKYISNMSVSEHRRPQMGSIIRKIKSKKNIFKIFISGWFSKSWFYSD